MTTSSSQTALFRSVKHHVEEIYKTVESIDQAQLETLSHELIQIMRLEAVNSEPTRYINHWDQGDCLVTVVAVF